MNEFRSFEGKEDAVRNVLCSVLGTSRAWAEGGYVPHYVAATAEGWIKEVEAIMPWLKQPVTSTKENVNG